MRKCRDRIEGSEASSRPDQVHYARMQVQILAPDFGGHSFDIKLGLQSSASPVRTSSCPRANRSNVSRGAELCESCFARVIKQVIANTPSQDPCLRYLLAWLVLRIPMTSSRIARFFAVPETRDTCNPAMNAATPTFICANQPFRVTEAYDIRSAQFLTDKLHDGIPNLCLDH
jgi:hypothetical protein